MVNTSLFPYAALDVHFELYYSGTWNNVTSYVRKQGEDIYCQITHGRADEATRPDPAKCTFLLNNIDGRFSPRNPRSPLYGLIGRNTPFRVFIRYNGIDYSRFYGEVSQWPIEWEVSGADIWVPMEASGISRRIGRRSQPVTSPIRRLMDTLTATMVGYWPMEDPSTSIDMGSGLIGGKNLVKRNVTGSSSLASNTDIDGSAPLPSMESGFWIGAATPYAPGTTLQFSFVMNAQSAPAAAALAVHCTMTGTAQAWSFVLLPTTGELEMHAYVAGTSVLTQSLSSSISTRGDTGPLNNPSRWSLELTQNGANIDYNVERYSIDANDGAHGTTGTLVGQTLGRMKDVRINDPASPLGSVAIGHVYASTTILDITSSDFYGADTAWADERPEARAARVCTENGIPFDQQSATTATDQVRMGPQPVASVSEILGECQDVGYLIFDDMQAFGLQMMPFEWRQDLNLAIAIPYGSLQTLNPVDDDQGLINDVTVSRSGGASSRYVVTSGALSTQDPPNGVGTYAAGISLNLSTDDKPQWWAQWLAAHGTYDDARFPNVCLNLLEDVGQTLVAQALAGLNISTGAGMEVGNLLRITSPPTWLPGGPIEAFINGWTEDLGPFCWDMEFNCTPVGPWRAWVVEDATRGHVDTAGSVTSGSFIAGTNTSMTVITNSGPRWVRAADQAAALPFDIMVSGCRLTVTAVSGTSSPQTFTISTTVVNGVAKTIPSGSAVNIAPVYVGV